jgi:uncharacterized protein (DUF2141 family)
MDRRNVCSAAVIAVVWLATAAPSFAQSVIAGVVRDASGGVLPGVSIEASSPALIERTRTVVSDEAGQYKIIDLRPGTYTVTFTLPGFSAVRREGIELPPNFTTSVNAEMRVGAMETSITVSGAAPVVDVQSAVKAQVLNSELLNACPPRGTSRQRRWPCRASRPAVSMSAAAHSSSRALLSLRAAAASTRS